MSQTREEKINISNVLTFVFLKKLLTPIVNSEAYKLGLIDNTGRVLRKPETPDEEASLTLLDRLVFKLRRLLGSKTTQLNNFLYLQTMTGDFFSKLAVKGSIEQRAEIQKIKKDIMKVAENNNCNITDLISVLITEQLKEGDK